MADDPRTMADILRRKAQRLIEAAELIEEVHGLNSNHRAPETVSREPKSGNTKKTGRPGNRLVQLIEFLKEYGPMARKDISVKSGIPIGTVHHLLGSSEFIKDSNGLWRVAAG